MTILRGEQVIISWRAPEDGGSPITDVFVYIRSSEGTYVLESTYCMSSDQTMIDDAECSVPKAFLNTAPYDLTWGSEIYAKVVA